MNPQVVGLESVPGTYPFDLRVSERSLRLNRFFWRMTEESWRERFRSDEEALMLDAGLAAHERQLVRSRDWIGLIRHGANFFVLEKFARTVKVTNLEVYAAMRGETLEAFLATRRVPDAR